MSEVKLFTRYIIPFAYEGVTFDKLQDNNKSWALSAESKIESDVYEYVRESFITEANADKEKNNYKIGCIYEYKGSYLENNFLLKYIHGEYQVQFYIRKVYLVLFQTEIGFMWFTPDIKSGFDNLDEAVDFNYHMKEMARDDRGNYLFIQQHVDVTDKNDVPNGFIPTYDKKNKKWGYNRLDSFYLGVWVDEIIKSIGGKYTYYASRMRTIENVGNRILPDKLVLFQCGRISKSAHVERDIVYLSRGFKDSYQLIENIESQMYKPFENVRYFAASEGCSYFVLSDFYTPDYFNDLTKVNNDYFYMYMLALYQNYTLLRYSDLISRKLSSSKEDYKNYSKELEDSLEDITTGLNIFLAKSVYSSVSHIQHQNEFFNYVSARLLIRENISSVTAGIEALNNIEGNLYEEEVEKRNNFLEGCLTVVSILALVSAFNDVNELIINHLYRWFPGTKPLLTWVFNAVLALVTAFIVGNLIKYIKYNPDRQKKKKERNKRT